MVADHWFMQIEKILKAMNITSNTTRIRLARGFPSTRFNSFLSAI